MKLDQRILTRFEELIGMGEHVLGTRASRSSGGVLYLGDDSVDYELSHQWGTSSLNLIATVFGKESDHYHQFNVLFPSFHDFSPIKKAMGVLKSAKDEYEHGFLLNAKALLEAEVFDDFLEQAQNHLDSGYHDTAAILAGSTLEDALRKLCSRYKVPLNDRPKIDAMNADLAKKGVYNSLTQKMITYLADIRNKAAHGKRNEFSKEDVQQMIKQVRIFLETFFS